MYIPGPTMDTGRNSSGLRRKNPEAGTRSAFYVRANLISTGKRIFFGFGFQSDRFHYFRGFAERTSSFVRFQSRSISARISIGASFFTIDQSRS